MKKIIIIIIAIVAIIIGAVCLYNHYHRFVLVNDGDKVFSFIFFRDFLISLNIKF